jgi:uncharacterized protein (TIGR03437 family)
MRPSWPWLLVCAAAALADPLPTATTLTLTTGPAVYGQKATVRAAVNAALGSIVFSVDGRTAQTVAVDPSQGTAFLDLYLAAGSHTVAASYDGGTGLSAGVYAPSTAAPLAIQVAKGATSVQAFNSTAQAGQSWTLSVYMVGTSSGIAPLTGTVSASTAANTAISCAADAARLGFYLCSGTFNAAGTFAVSLSYSGDANTLPSSASITVTVGKVTPAVYVASSPDAPVYGQTVTVGLLALGAPNVAPPGGSVTFSESGHALGTGSIGADGRAVYAGTFPVGSHTVSAVYGGDGNYTASVATATFTVAKAPTVTTVSSDAAQLDQTFRLYASVALSGGSGTAGGSVTFSAGGQPIANCSGLVPASSSDGVARCSTSFAALGSYTVTVQYSGDGNTLASSASLAVTVGKAAAGVFVSATPSNPVYGATVTVGALALAAPGVAAPTGSVTLTDGGRTLAVQALGADGRASWKGTLAAGSHTFGASYSGDGNYQAGSAAAATLTVSKAATTISLAAVTGGPFTASVNVVAPGGGTPTGVVQFLGGGAVIGTAMLGTQGPPYQAVLATSSAGGSIVANYGGDANFLSSFSDAVIVPGVQSQVTVTSGANPGTAGQSIGFTVTVGVTPRAVYGTPTGTVTLSVDGVATDSAACCSTAAVFHAAVPVGSHTVTARYSGDANYPAASGSLTEVVNPAAATLSLSSGAAAAVYGQPVTLTARLAGPSGGTIQFGEGAIVLGTADTSSGSASLSLTLPAGSHTITATWPGDGTWAAASAQMVQVVNKAATATALALSGGNLAAAISVAPPGAGTPSGSVRFLDAASAASLGSAPVNAAAAAMPLPASADSVAASYSGDANFLPSLSPTLNLLTMANAASYGTGAVAPDEIAVWFGPDLAPGTVISIRDGAGKTHMLTPLYATANQVSAVLPSDLAAGPATVTVTSNVRTLTASTIVTGAAPGLFTADSSGKGAPAGQVMVVHAGGAADPMAAASDPIDWSDPNAAVYLVLYGTGLRHAGTVTCTAGGQPATVAFSGAQPDQAGLDQVNVLLPASLRAAGTFVLTVTAGGQTSNPVTLAVR